MSTFWGTDHIGKVFYFLLGFPESSKFNVSGDWAEERVAREPLISGQGQEVEEGFVDVSLPEEVQVGLGPEAADRQREQRFCFVGVHATKHRISFPRALQERRHVCPEMFVVVLLEHRDDVLDPHAAQPLGLHPAIHVMESCGVSFLHPECFWDVNLQNVDRLGAASPFDREVVECDVTVDPQRVRGYPSCLSVAEEPMLVGSTIRPTVPFESERAISELRVVDHHFEDLFDFGHDWPPFTTHPSKERERESCKGPGRFAIDTHQNHCVYYTVV